MRKTLFALLLILLSTLACNLTNLAAAETPLPMQPAGDSPAVESVTPQDSAATEPPPVTNTCPI